MTEKELIRQSMASNLKLPTDLTADEAIEKKPAKASVRFSYLGRALVFAALALTVGAAGFLYISSSHKPEALSSQQQISPVSQQQNDSAKQQTVMPKGIDKEPSEFISQLVSDDKKFYAISESSVKYDESECADVTQESRHPDVHSRTAAALGKYLMNVKEMKTDSGMIFTLNNIRVLAIHRKDGSGSLVYTENSDHNGSVKIRLGNNVYYYYFDNPNGKYGESFFTQYGKNLPIDWETNTSVCKDFVTKQELESTNGRTVISREVRDNISISYKINTLYDAAFIEDIDVKIPGGVRIKDDKMTIKLTPHIKGASQQTLDGLTTTSERDKDGSILLTPDKKAADTGRMLFKSKESYKDTGECVGYDVQFKFEVYDDSNPLGFGREYTSVTTIHSYYGINSEVG